MEELLNSHFIEGEQRYHKMLSAQQVGMRVGVALRLGWLAAYGLTTLCLDPSVFLYKSFYVLGI